MRKKNRWKILKESRKNPERILWTRRKWKGLVVLCDDVDDGRPLSNVFGDFFLSLSSVPDVGGVVPGVRESKCRPLRLWLLKAIKRRNKSTPAVEVSGVVYPSIDTVAALNKLPLFYHLPDVAFIAFITLIAFTAFIQRWTLLEFIFYSKPVNFQSISFEFH